MLRMEYKLEFAQFNILGNFPKDGGLLILQICNFKYFTARQNQYCTI